MITHFTMHDINEFCDMSDTDERLCYPNHIIFKHPVIGDLYYTIFEGVLYVTEGNTLSRYEPDEWPLGSERRIGTSYTHWKNVWSTPITEEAEMIMEDLPKFLTFYMVL